MGSPLIKRLDALYQRAQMVMKVQADHAPFVSIAPWSFMKNECIVKYYPEGHYQKPEQITTTLHDALMIAQYYYECGVYVQFTMSLCIEWLFLYVRDDPRYSPPQQKSWYTKCTEEYPEIKYIFSNQIRISPNFLKRHGIQPQVREKVQFVSADNNYKVDDIEITTLRSTDAGVAFYINTNGVSIFHAGDLNDWEWEGAGDLINGRMRRSFRHEIKKISDKPLNIAFFPLDPRLGEHEFDGIDFFVKNTNAEYVFPMHMWQDYSKIKDFKRRLTNRQAAERVIEIERENQSFAFEENY